LCVVAGRTMLQPCAISSASSAAAAGVEVGQPQPA
jgi:hypothetical protein